MIIYVGVVFVFLFVSISIVGLVHYLFELWLTTKKTQMLRQSSKISGTSCPPPCTMRLSVPTSCSVNSLRTLSKCRNCTKTVPTNWSELSVITSPLPQEDLFPPRERTLNLPNYPRLTRSNGIPFGNAMRPSPPSTDGTIDILSAGCPHASETRRPDQLTTWTLNHLPTWQRPSQPSRRSTSTQPASSSSRPTSNWPRERVTRLSFNGIPDAVSSTSELTRRPRGLNSKKTSKKGSSSASRTETSRLRSRSPTSMRLGLTPTSSTEPRRSTATPWSFTQLTPTSRYLQRVLLPWTITPQDLELHLLDALLDDLQTTRAPPTRRTSSDAITVRSLDMSSTNALPNKETSNKRKKRTKRTVLPPIKLDRDQILDFQERRSTDPTHLVDQCGGEDVVDQGQGNPRADRGSRTRRAVPG